MTEAVIVAAIGLIGTIISVCVSAKATQTKVTNELQTQNAVQNEKIEALSSNMGQINNELIQKIEHSQEVDEIKFKNLESGLDTMKEDIRSHNHYAQLFNENLPVIKEKLKVTENRLLDLEHEVKDLRDKNNN